MTARSPLRVRVEPARSEFFVADGETVLQAAERHGVALKYGCRHGNCSTCKYQVLEGEIDFGQASPYALSEREREDGFVLLCCARPMSDIVVLNDREPDRRALPVISPRECDVVVQAVEELSPSLWRLRLQLADKLNFHPGQFVELKVPDSVDEWRSYSISSPPSRVRDLEFIIKRVPGGLFSGRLSDLASGTAVRMRGPLGNSYLRPGSQRVLLVGVGSGIAPLLSMLRHAADSGDVRQFALVYGGRTRRDLALLDEIAPLASRIRLDVLAAVSQPTPQCRWTGRIGRVTRVVQREIESAHDLDAYLCGSPEICDEVKRLLEAKGIKDGSVFQDPFFATSAQKAPASTRS